MSKLCIFDNSKLCNDCGDCDICDLDHSKKCNNCGKCLELQGYDMKAIDIDEIIEDEEDTFEENIENDSDTYEPPSENDEVWEYIDDIKDIDQLLEEEKHYKHRRGVHEEFPGLIILRKDKDQE